MAIPECPKSLCVYSTRQDEGIEKITRAQVCNLSRREMLARVTPCPDGSSLPSRSSFERNNSHSQRHGESEVGDRSGDLQYSLERWIGYPRSLRHWRERTYRLGRAASKNKVGVLPTSFRSSISSYTNLGPKTDGMCTFRHGRLLL